MCPVTSTVWSQCSLADNANSGLYQKIYVEEALKDALGGSHIVLKATYNSAPLAVIGYRYSTKPTLYFVATKDQGSTRPADM